MATNKPVYVDELYGELEIGQNGEKWFVIYTKPQHEKQLAIWAKTNNIYYYLPQVEKEHVYQHKKVIFTKPLFPGYFFAKCTLKEKDKLIVSGHCVYFLKVDIEKELVEDLKRISLVRNAHIEMKDHVYLEKGMVVCFKEGPLKGQQGIVQDSTNLNKVVLQVKIMKRAVAIEANPETLEILSNYDEYQNENDLQNNESQEIQEIT